MDTGYVVTRRASLEVLRAEAEDERSTMIDGRLRRGEDPWEFMQELPSVDELVVLLQREEYLETVAGGAPGAAHDVALLHAISDAYPGLAGTVRALIAGTGRTGTRWVARGRS